MNAVRRRVVAALSASIVATTSLATTAASADSAVAAGANPTFITAPFAPVQHVHAFAVGSLGLTPLTLYPNAACDRGQSRVKSLASVTIPGVLTASGLKAACSVDGDGTQASAAVTIAELSLLGGRVRLTAVDAVCHRDPDGTATDGATWGSFVTAANYSRNGAGAIVIPGVADIYVDQRYLGGTFGDAEMLVVTIYPQQVGGLTVVPAQTLVIAGCVLDADA